MFTTNQTKTNTKESIIKATKPKPPLTAYNLYFQVERKRILEGTDSLGLPISNEDMKLASLVHKAKTGKRLHRKTHGKIGFKELARVVASRWKQLDPGTKQMLEDQAEIEKQEHATLFEEWKKTDEYKQEMENMERDEKNSHKMSCDQAKKPPALVEEAAPQPSSSPGRVERQDLKVQPTTEFEMFQSMWKELEPNADSVAFPNETQQCGAVGIMFKESAHHRRRSSLSILGLFQETTQAAYMFPRCVSENDNAASSFVDANNFYTTTPLIAQTNVQWDSAHLLEPIRLFATVATAAIYPQGICGFKPFTGFGSSSMRPYINGSTHIKEKRNQCSSNSLSTSSHEASGPFEEINQWDELCYFASRVESL